MAGLTGHWVHGGCDAQVLVAANDPQDGRVDLVDVQREAVQAAVVGLH